MKFPGELGATCKLRVRMFKSARDMSTKYYANVYLVPFVKSLEGSEVSLLDLPVKYHKGSIFRKEAYRLMPKLGGGV